MKEMTAIYLASTPYHILIAHGLATSCDDSNEKYLILLSNFDDADIWCRELNKWENCPFSQVMLLTGNYKIVNEGRLNRVKYIRKNIKMVKDFLGGRKMNTACEIFIFNDSTPESQILAYLNTKKGGRNIYVEDGVGVYSSYMLPDMACYKKVLATILFGHWYEHIRIFGMYKYIDEIMVFHPEVVREELKGRSIIKIPEDVLDNLKTQDFISTLSRIYDVNLNDLKVDYIGLIDGPCVLPLYPEYKKLYPELFNLATDSFDSFFVKYHPREKQGDFLKLYRNKKITLLPSPLPIETIYLFLEKPPKVIIGGSSTSLLTAKRIFKDTTYIISIRKILNFPELEIFNKLGILMPESVKELNEIIHHIRSESDGEPF